MSEITILGAYGTKGTNAETSSFLVDEHNVIDAGNLLHGLKESAAAIEAVWITHSHLDHIIDIAYILDSYFAERRKPLKLMGLPETLLDIRNHFLNDKIWPDFSMINMMGSEEKIIEYHPIEIGKTYALSEGVSIEAFETDHTVVSCGYVVKKGESGVAITADTFAIDGLLAALKKHPWIRSLVIECSFPSDMDELARVSKHLTPRLLFEKIDGLSRADYRLYINHIKPLFETAIRSEIGALKGDWKCSVLKDGDKIQF
jgi:ribonuclease BN (tRNA processing enzyme)